MLIKITNNVRVLSYAQLLHQTISLLTPDTHASLTAVFGPVTADSVLERQANLHKIRLHEEALSEDGWSVLALSSLQPHYQHIQQEARTAGYPYDILNLFIFPLIESGYLRKAHVLQNWQTSFGTRQEHEKLEREGIPINYVP